MVPSWLLPFPTCICTRSISQETRTSLKVPASAMPSLGENPRPSSLERPPLISSILSSRPGLLSSSYTNCHCIVSETKFPAAPRPLHRLALQRETTLPLSGLHREVDGLLAHSDISCLDCNLRSQLKKRKSRKIKLAISQPQFPAPENLPLLKET